MPRKHRDSWPKGEENTWTAARVYPRRRSAAAEDVCIGSERKTRAPILAFVSTEMSKKRKEGRFSRLVPARRVDMCTRAYCYRRFRRRSPARRRRKLISGQAVRDYRFVTKKRSFPAGKSLSHARAHEETRLIHRRCLGADKTTRARS